jgi:hypothetical protein
MGYCKYHPLTPAAFHCQHCDIDFCGHCINEDPYRDTQRCFHCQQDLDPLGARNSAPPFWRRLQETFHYPLQAQPLIFIALISFLSALLSFTPFAMLGVLVLSGIMMKYCFSCLESTARGQLNPPDITTAYEGGVALMLSLILILVLMGGAVVAVGLYLGPTAAGLLATLMVISLPAVMINFAMSENLLFALNPLNSIKLIHTIGLPYGLLLGFILIMISSVGAIGGLFGSQISVLSLGLQSVVSNYYTVVAFHMMGYMLFQYQFELGFVAQTDEDSEARSDRDRLLAHIDVCVKEGQFGKALKLFSEGVHKYANDRELFEMCFNFMCATKNREHIGNFTSSYLQLLQDQGRPELVRGVFKRARDVNTEYQPTDIKLRVHLARDCHDSGDFMTAIKLINGLHKQHPEHPLLLEAYHLMAEAMEQVPKMAAQLPACHKLIAQLKKQTAAAPVQKSPQKTRPKPTVDSAPKPTLELEPVEPADGNNNDLPPIEFR